MPRGAKKKEETEKQEMEGEPTSVCLAAPPEGRNLTGFLEMFSWTQVQEGDHTI